MEISPLTAKQRASVQLATARLNLWEGSVRSSKTVCSLLRWVQFVLHGPQGNLLMTGKTERTLKRNIIDPLTEMLGPARCRLVAGTGELFLLGRRVYLAGANDERSQERIRGLTLAGAYADEVSTLPASFWSMLLSRLSVDGAQLFGTSNPDSPAHWLKRDFLDRSSVWLEHDGSVSRAEGIDLARFSFRLRDNPHLPPAYVASLEQEFVGLWHKRFIEGLWVAAEGAIYDMFDVSRHVVDICPVIKRWICTSIDYGTVNPLHALLIGIGVDRRLYVVSEWRWDSRARHRQLTDAEYSLKIREWLASVQFPGSRLHGVTPERIVVDPSAASFRVQLHNDGMLVTEGNNAVLDGIRQVASLLGSGRLLIHQSCRSLIEEMAGYTWDDAARLKGEDKPVKVNDHGCFVAGTPVLTAGARKPIDTIKPGEMVMTRQGLRPVAAAGMTSLAAATVRVGMSSGQHLEGTGNHPVWVAGHGWKRLDALRYGDILETWQSPRSSPIRESASGATRTPPGGPSGPTSSRESETGRSAAWAGYTKRSGRTPMGRSRRAATSTTTTTTPSTTTRPTWSASTALSTAATISRRWIANLPSIWRTSRLSGRSPLSGTGAMKAELGTARTVRRPGRPGRRFRPPASSAAGRTSRSPGAKRTGSARTPASQSGVALRGWTTSSGPAIGAARGSVATGTTRRSTAPVHVVSVAASRERVPVYNLTVTDCPEYYAAGVLVHNCDSLRYGIMTTRQLWRNELIPVEIPVNYEDHFGVAL